MRPSREPFDCSLATLADNRRICELLREHAMPGGIHLAFERDPDAYTAGFGLASTHDFLLVRDPQSGETIALCERKVMSVFVDAEVCNISYLGALRVVSGYRNRIRVLKSGFEAVGRLVGTNDDLPYALTAIADDNVTAKRILCAGLPELPRYRPEGDLCTFVISTRGKCAPAQIVHATAADLDEIACFLNEVNKPLNFAPYWSAAALRMLHETGALPAEHYLLIRRGGCLHGCASLWDQSACKRTRVTGYSGSTDWLRPLYNAFAMLTGRVTLPPVGALLNQVFISHLAVRDDNPADFLHLLEAAVSQARKRGFSAALLGLPGSHPLADCVRRDWPSHEYRTRLHTVHWTGNAAAPPMRTQRLPRPEIALM